jgi:hypothetical protein
MNDAARVGLFEVDVDDVAAPLQDRFGLPYCEGGFPCCGDRDEGVPASRIEELDAVVTYTPEVGLFGGVGAV